MSSSHCRPLNGWLLYSKTPDRLHRKVTAGMVNFVQLGQFFFVKDSGAGLLVESTAADVEAGARPEAAGFVENTLGHP